LRSKDVSQDSLKDALQVCFAKLLHPKVNVIKKASFLIGLVIRVPVVVEQVEIHLRNIGRVFFPNLCAIHLLFIHNTAYFNQIQLR
jgi:hypothetical protein